MAHPGRCVKDKTSGLSPSLTHRPRCAAGQSRACARIPLSHVVNCPFFWTITIDRCDILCYHIKARLVQGPPGPWAQSPVHLPRQKPRPKGRGFCLPPGLTIHHPHPAQRNKTSFILLRSSLLCLSQILTTLWSPLGFIFLSPAPSVQVSQNSLFRSSENNRKITKRSEKTPLHFRDYSVEWYHKIIQFGGSL